MTDAVTPPSPNKVVSASILASEANLVKAKLASAEAQLETMYEYVATLYQAHHVVFAAVAGFIVGASFGIIV